MTERVSDRKNAMANYEVKSNGNEEPYLKGTFVSVMLLGSFLALSWLAVFFLYISRN